MVYVYVELLLIGRIGFGWLHVAEVKGNLGGIVVSGSGLVCVWCMTLSNGVAGC